MRKGGKVTKGIIKGGKKGLIATPMNSIATKKGFGKGK